MNNKRPVSSRRAGGALAVALGLWAVSVAADSDSYIEKLCSRYGSVDATRKCMQLLAGQFLDPQIIPICERWSGTQDRVDCLGKLSERRYSAEEVRICDRYYKGNPALAQDCLAELRWSGSFVDPKVFPICQRWFHTQDQAACLKKLAGRRYSDAQLRICDRYDKGNPALAQDCLAGMGGASVKPRR